jgi:hypothetical protein
VFPSHGTRLDSMYVFVFVKRDPFVFGIDKQKACASMGTAGRFEIGNEVSNKLSNAKYVKKSFFRSF